MRTAAATAGSRPRAVRARYGGAAARGSRCGEGPSSAACDGGAGWCTCSGRRRAGARRRPSFSTRCPLATNSPAEVTRGARSSRTPSNPCGTTGRASRRRRRGGRTPPRRRRSSTTRSGGQASGSRRGAAGSRGSLRRGPLSRARRARVARQGPSSGGARASCRVRACRSSRRARRRPGSVGATPTWTSAPPRPTPALDPRRRDGETERGGWGRRPGIPVAGRGGSRWRGLGRAGTVGFPASSSPNTVVPGVVKRGSGTGNRPLGIGALVVNPVREVLSGRGSGSPRRVRDDERD